MPDSEHPVTVGDLFIEVQRDGKFVTTYRPATVADLVSALRAEGLLVIEKAYGEWPEWATRVEHHEYTMFHIFDALAEAQPFPPAGE